MRYSRVVLLLGVSVLLTSCIVRMGSVTSLTPDSAVGTDVRTPLKAFHVDGTITVFPSGARVTDEWVMGSGTRYSLDLSSSSVVQRVPLDSLVGIEAFRGGTSPIASVLLSSLAVVAAVGGFKAAFGSCPTIYTYEDGEEVLHAEAFSYSIAPLLEARDVDRLATHPDERGRVRLEVRNEALETHYINHLELLAIREPTGRRAYANEEGRIVSVGTEVEPLSAHDRDGRALTEQLHAADQDAFASSGERIRAITAHDYWEHVDLTFPHPGGESAALVLRLRNSLLTTVLFYDMMLGAQGARALDWMGAEVNRIGRAAELGRWFQETMGMRVSVLGRGGWREVARVADTGPIAWEEVAVTVPLPDAGDVHIRLTFLADEWRIDRAALAAGVRRAEVETIPITRVRRLDGSDDDALRSLLAEPDDEYVATTAGTALEVDFDVPAAEAGEDLTLFLSSQGYYTEWVRPEWIRSAADSEGFRPTKETIVELMERWIEQKDTIEREFHASRIPVR